MGTVTIYKERPHFLVYHEKSFHIMDIKQCQCTQVGFGSVDEILGRSNFYTPCCHSNSMTFDNMNVADMQVKSLVLQESRNIKVICKESFIIF